MCVLLSSSNNIGTLVILLVQLSFHASQLLLHFVEMKEYLQVRIILLHKKFPHKGFDHLVNVNSLGVKVDTHSVDDQVNKLGANFFIHYFVINKVSKNANVSFSEVQFNLVFWRIMHLIGPIQHVGKEID